MAVISPHEVSDLWHSFFAPVHKHVVSAQSSQIAMVSHSEGLDQDVHRASVVGSVVGFRAMAGFGLRHSYRRPAVPTA